MSSINATNTPPPAEGVRLAWWAVPEIIRQITAEGLSSAIIQADSQPTGFSPGVAARCLLEDGRRVFVKAVSGAQNPISPLMHRREAQIVAALPTDAPVPRLLWSYDEGEAGWVVLVYEEIVGRTPSWEAGDLPRVMQALEQLSDALTPSPLPAALIGTAADEFNEHISGWRKLLSDPPEIRDQLDRWSGHHLEKLAEIEADAAAGVAGNTLLHFDLRADNMLITPEKVWFVDFPLARVGAPWVDVAFFAPSATMQGAPAPEIIMAQHAACRAADPRALTAAVVAIAGFFTRHALFPAPQGLPTLRAFQAAQGAVARAWVAERTGFTELL